MVVIRVSNTYINLTFESKIDWVKKINEYQEEIKRLKEEYMILQNASDEVEEEKDKEIERLKHREKELKYFNDILENQNIEKSKETERLKTNLQVANEDLTRIAQLLDLEECCTIYDIEDKIGKYKSIIKEVRECINHYAIENEDYSKIYNDEEKELLEILDKGRSNESYRFIK